MIKLLRWNQPNISNTLPHRKKSCSTQLSRLKRVSNTREPPRCAAKCNTVEPPAKPPTFSGKFFVANLGDKENGEWLGSFGKVMKGGYLQLLSL